MKRLWGSLPFLLWAALVSAQVQPGEPFVVAPSVPYVQQAALPAPLLPPVAEPVDPYLPVLEKTAAANGIDIRLVKDAMARMAVRVGVPLSQIGMSPAQLERQLKRELERGETERLAADWPDNSQSRFMKGLIANIRVKSGKSVEEIARAGAFAYFRLSGAYVSSAESGRDPDVQTDAVFYVTYERGRFKFSLYSQGRFVSYPDSSVRRWLSTGLPTLKLD